MPRVPYQPYSEVAPSGAGINIPVSGEAFGVGTARAAQGLGRELETASDRLFNRAMAFQQLQNDTESTDLQVQAAKAGEKIFEEYGSLEGRDAVQRHDEFIDKLEKSRQAVGEGASNPAVKRSFEMGSKQTMIRTMFSMGRHSATEQKKYSEGAAKADMELSVQQISNEPLDEILFKNKMTNINSKIDVIAGLRGLDDSDPQIQRLRQQTLSHARRRQIESVARVDPPTADGMMEKYKKDLTEDDAAALFRTIRSEARSLGVHQLVDKVFTEGEETETKPGKSPKEMEAEIRKQAREMFPNDQVAQDGAVTTLRGRIGVENRIKADEQKTHTYAVDQAIVASGAKTVQELKADPKTAAHIEALSDKEQLGLQAKINRYQKSITQQTNRDNYSELYGMLKGNPIKFLNEDITKWQLNDGDMRFFIREQEKVKQVPHQDPRVQQAVGWMRAVFGSEMRAAGVYSAPPSTDTARGSDWDKFMGELSIAMEEQVKATGKPVSREDIVKKDGIGSQVLKKASEPYLFGLLSSDVPYFKRTLNADELERFKKARVQELEQAGEPVPSDEQLERLYRRMDYIKLHGKRDRQ